MEERIIKHDDMTRMTVLYNILYLFCLYLQFCILNLYGIYFCLAGGNEGHAHNKHKIIFSITFGWAQNTTHRLRIKRNAILSYYMVVLLWI